MTQLRGVFKREKGAEGGKARGFQALKKTQKPHGRREAAFPCPRPAVFRRTGAGEGNQDSPFARQHRSRGCGKEGGHHLPRRLPAEALLRTIVQEHVDPLQVRLADGRERDALRIQAADQPVRVLVCSPFPRVVRPGEEHLRLQSRGDLRVAGELLAVVERDTRADHAVGGEQPDDFGGGRPGEARGTREERGEDGGVP